MIQRFSWHDVVAGAPHTDRATPSAYSSAPARTTVEQAVRQLEERLFVNRDRELSAFRRWLATRPTNPEILNVTGPGGVGKSRLLRAFQSIAREQGWTVVSLDAHDFRATPEGLLHAFGATSLDQAVDRLNAGRRLVLIDTFEEMGDLTRHLRDDVLPRLDVGVRVVIAGRYPLGLAWSRVHTVWHTLIRPLPLTGLSAAGSRAYLQRRGVDDPALAAEILRAAGGHPLALSLAADLALQLGARGFAAAPEWRMVVRSLVEQLLRDVRDPELRALIDVCAVVREFDEAVLAAVSGRDDVESAFAQLCQLSVVRPAAHGLTLHDDVRRILTDDLRWRRRDRYDALRLRALAYFRERARTAPPTEQEWLLAERFALWENGLVQAVFFAEGEPGEIWLEPGRPDDHDDVQRIWRYFREHLSRRASPPELDDRAFLDAMLAYDGSRLRIARDRTERALGFSLILPVCTESLPLLRGNPVLAPLLEAYLSRADASELPTTAEATRVFYLLHLAHVDAPLEAVRAALLRDLIGVFALGGTYLSTTPVELYQRVLEALGFERVAGTTSLHWGREHPAHGYMLDLTDVGVDAWIEATVAGRSIPHRLAGEELQRELQRVLLHWHEDTTLAASPLIPLLVPGEPVESVPDALRSAIASALARARTHARPQQALAYRALELAYLERAVSQERIAEQLAVSRTTFYRLLKRGLEGLTQLLGRG